MGDFVISLYGNTAEKSPWLNCFAAFEILLKGVVSLSVTKNVTTPEIVSMDAAHKKNMAIRLFIKAAVLLASESEYIAGYVAVGVPCG